MQKLHCLIGDARGVPNLKESYSLLKTQRLTARARREQRKREHRRKQEMKEK
jgi:hypothetical protein